jgi:hypothetical protein
MVTPVEKTTVFNAVIARCAKLDTLTPFSSLLFLAALDALERNAGWAIPNN